MNLYIKQHIFTWSDRFTVYTENGNEYCYVDGEMFSWGKKLHIVDDCNRELAFISQKLLTFMPRYNISVNGRDIAEVVKKFTFFVSEFNVSGLDWTVQGDFLSHEYTARDRNGAVCFSVSKKWFTWGDTYELDIARGTDEITALAVTLVIDACMSSNQNN